MNIYSDPLTVAALTDWRRESLSGSSLHAARRHRHGWHPRLRLHRAAHGHRAPRPAH